MQEALRADLTAGFAGNPLRHFVRRAAELLLQVGLEDVVTTVLGRGHYERADGTVPGYRNGYGHHALKTEAGVPHLRPPKVRDTETPVSVTLPDDLRPMTPELGALIRRSYVRGLSMRDVEGLYAEVFGGSVSKSAASRATQVLQAEFDTWRTRDLSELRVLYLFLDGQFHAVRAASTAKEGILAAYALCEDGKVVLLHLGLGPRESTDAWVAFLHDLTARGVGTPFLVITDGNPGLTRAVKQVFPGVPRQRCQVHKLRNILAKLPKPAATQLKPLIQQVFLAPDHATGLRRGRALIARLSGPVPLRHGVPGEGPRRVPHVLAVPKGASEAAPHDEPAGAHLRGVAPPDEGRPTLPRRAELSHAHVRHTHHRGAHLARDPGDGEDPPRPRQAAAATPGHREGAGSGLTSPPTPVRVYTRAGA